MRSLPENGEFLAVICVLVWQTGPPDASGTAERASLTAKPQVGKITRRPRSAPATPKRKLLPFPARKVAAGAPSRPGSSQKKARPGPKVEARHECGARKGAAAQPGRGSHAPRRLRARRLRRARGRRSPWGRRGARSGRGARRRRSRGIAQGPAAERALLQRDAAHALDGLAAARAGGRPGSRSISRSKAHGVSSSHQGRGAKSTRPGRYGRCC